MQIMQGDLPVDGPTEVKPILLSISRSSINGSLAAPSSKSQVQRLVALGVLTRGQTVIEGVTACDDVRSAVAVAEGMGAAVSWEKSTLVLDGVGLPLPGRFECGESGLCLRMFAAVAGLADETVVLHASGSLRNRPVSMLKAPMEALGARCDCEGGHAPVAVRGPFKGRRANVDGSVTSQFLTGLLIALPRASGDSELDVVGLHSAPYVEMTLDLVKRAGGRVSVVGLSHFTIKGGQRYTPRTWQTEGDWSGAAFLLVAGAIAGRVRVTGLDPSSRQADSRVVEVLRMAGADVSVGDDWVECRHNRLKSFVFDATDCPDLIPPMVALASHCEGASVLGGSARLRNKESDRAKALVDVFNATGISVVDDGASLLVTGGIVGGGHVHAHGDHRIAMALAVAGLGGVGPVVIDGAGCVSKSYEGFFDDICQIGAVVDHG